MNFDPFRTLPSSQASGAQQIGRLTNLTQLSVDTSWYTRYRTSAGLRRDVPPGDSGTGRRKVFGHPADQRRLRIASHAQALANTAAFHFGFIEQGGLSLYATLAEHVSEAEVLRILFSIGGDEIAHFLEWVDFAGNGVQTPCGSTDGPEHWPDLSGLQCHYESAAPDQLDLPRSVRVHQREAASLLGDPSNGTGPDQCRRLREGLDRGWFVYRPATELYSAAG